MGAKREKVVKFTDRQTEVFTSFFFFLAIYQGTVLQTYVTKQLKPLLDLRYFWGEHLITLL